MVLFLLNVALESPKPNKSFDNLTCDDARSCRRCACSRGSCNPWSAYPTDSQDDGRPWCDLRHPRADDRPDSSRCHAPSGGCRASASHRPCRANAECAERCRLRRSPPYIRRGPCGSRRHASAGAARELGASARLHLDAVHRGADRDIAERQAIAGRDRRIARADQLRTRFHAFGRDNIAAFAVGVYQQCDMGAAVRVVIETFDHSRDADLVAAEVDDAIVLLVTAALMTHGDAAQVIAAAVFLESLDQRLVRPAFVQARLHHLDHKAAARGSGLYFNQCHRLYPSLQTARETYCAPANSISKPGFNLT